MNDNRKPGARYDAAFKKMILNEVKYMPKGMKQVDIANKYGINEATISYWKGAEAKKKNDKKLIKLVPTPTKIPSDAVLGRLPEHKTSKQPSLYKVLSEVTYLQTKFTMDLFQVEEKLGAVLKEVRRDIWDVWVPAIFLLIQCTLLLAIFVKIMFFGG
jgi:hypothetical protein